MFEVTQFNVLSSVRILTVHVFFISVANLIFGEKLSI